jgi:two-component system, OmpR family, response regulator ChvI
MILEMIPQKRNEKRILIVDDEPDITFSLKEILKEYGFVYVYTFNDPVEVISKYTKPRIYDFLIIDIVMPKINGFELYEKIKKIDNKVKACFITAYKIYYKSLREIYPNFEVDCFITKPIQNEDLLKAVQDMTPPVIKDT